MTAFVKMHGLGNDFVIFDARERLKRRYDKTRSNDYRLPMRTMSEREPS